MDLFNLGCTGPKFTWGNKASGCCFVRARLNRGLAYPSWLQRNPNFQLNNIESDHLNHLAIQLWTDSRPIHQARLKKRFKFESYWTHVVGSEQTISQRWQRVPLINVVKDYFKY